MAILFVFVLFMNFLDEAVSIEGKILGNCIHTIKVFTA